jgi:hypothetical protein
MDFVVEHLSSEEFLLYGLDQHQLEWDKFYRKPRKRKHEQAPKF